MKKLLKAIGLYTLLLVVIPFAILEAAFRLLPVASPPYLQPVNAANPVPSPNASADMWSTSMPTRRLAS